MFSDKQSSKGPAPGRVGAFEAGRGDIGDILTPPSDGLTPCEIYHKGIFDSLGQADLHVYDLLRAEYERLQSTIQLIAAENQCSQAVLAALGSVVQNKTTEGFVGARYHGGCDVVDNIETLAVSRAKEVFGAKYANVQPHSGTAANQIVLTAILARGDKILSLGVDQGGHLSHGARASFTGKFFDVENYYVERAGFLLDYDAIRAKAIEVRPKLIVCGASAYSRTIDFAKFRAIADEVGAYVLADVSHIAGLIAAGAHPSSIDHAHFTTTSTYKPGGPRGGLILMGRDFDSRTEVGAGRITLSEHIDRTTFPGVQGTPYLNNVAAKAVFFKEMESEEYRDRQFKIIANARSLASAMSDRGYHVLTGGTDNHMLLIDVGKLRPNLSGLLAQRALEQCGLIVNMNRLPYDTKKASITSGLRLGTPIVTKNGMGPEQMRTIAALIDAVLRGIDIIGEREYRIEDTLKTNIKEEVLSLSRKFPMR
ncbi:MAG: serine hydroxymethyltransferase [Planctomycetota bacterium]|jgi:glycine hydroxymethyltransferase